MQTGNFVQLIGYVGNHLKVRMLGESKKAMIRVATHHTIKSGNGEVKSITTWHDVAAWGKIADYAVNHFVKGSRILVQGHLVYRQSLANTNNNEYGVEIKAGRLINLDQ